MGTTVQTHIGRRIVDLTPTEFFHLIHQLPQPQVKINSEDTGLYRYVVRYRGFTFQTQSHRKLQLPSNKPVARAIETVLPYIKVERKPPLQL